MKAEKRALNIGGVAALSLALALVVVAGFLALEARAQTEAPTESARLKTRIKNLEEAIARHQAGPGTAKEGAEPPAPVVAQQPPEIFSTKAWASIEAAPATTPRETIDGLLGFITRKDGAGLVKEMLALMASGDTGHAVLQDFLHALDKQPEASKRLVGSYDLAFALMHLGMIEEKGSARLAHSYFSATRKTTRTVLRGYLYSFLPVFLSFHQGRFPDLEQDLLSEILQLVRDGDKRLRMLLSAAESLGYFLPIDVIEKRLAKATDFQAHSALILHLGARDDKEAVDALRAFVVKNMRLYGGATSQALVTLARMSDPGVERVFRELTWTKDALTYSKAIRAYFAIPRSDGFTPEARRYLNSRVSFPDKKLFINQLRRVNPGILAELRAMAEQIQSDEVREFLLK